MLLNKWNDKIKKILHEDNYNPMEIGKTNKFNKNILKSCV
jgi:hypothetical protein